MKLRLVVLLVHMVLQDIEVEELKTKELGGTQGKLSSGLSTQEEKKEN